MIISRQPAIIKQQLTPDRLVSHVPHQIEMEFGKIVDQGQGDVPLVKLRLPL
jgi:hypothetical protein